MTPSILAEVTVLVRIALYAISGALLSAGLITASMAATLVGGPMVMLVSGVVVFVGAAIWYKYSEARQAYKDWREQHVTE